MQAQALVGIVALPAAAWVFRRTLGVGGAVGVSAAANVFVGMVEAPLLIRPYLERLGRGEIASLGLRSIVAGTLATCLSGVVAGLLT